MILPHYLAPVLIAGNFMALVSSIKEPARRKFMAMMVADLSAFGMGYREFVFTVAAT